MADLTYAQKEGIADKYLFRTYGTCWADLADTNSLHDAESVEEIHQLCEERIQADMDS